MGAPRTLTAPPRLVIDTNVVLSALIFRQGRLAWLPPKWQHRAIVPLVNTATGSELVRALSYPKFRLAITEREDLLAKVLPYCEGVAVPTDVPAVPPCRDADDRKFLELAAAARADALITGDEDLLALADSFGVPIWTPNELQARMAAGV